MGLIVAGCRYLCKGPTRRPPQPFLQDVESAVIEVHVCAVDLAERVLPALQKIGASALGFAVVSFFTEPKLFKVTILLMVGRNLAFTS